MSAPETEFKKESRRHRPALIGIAAAVIAGGLFFLFNTESAFDGEDPSLQGVEASDLPAVPAD